MAEQQFALVLGGQWHCIAQHLGKPLIGQFHLVAEYHLGRFTVLGDDPAPLIVIEQGMIQPHDRYQCGESKLPGLQDQVSMPQPLDQTALGSVWNKWNH
ncbi:MAG TPA: hypothetical protein PKJ41_16925 [Bryobacteraceae bacterium]|nr:hypothetical protein [Bryobacteraceae bacterium]